ncbi:MAG: glycosyltransferase family 2 protein [Candidatus Omnitrophica bacterium]|nr:glycosyltransferase family 2 protein [Candidatus Omnitrophota bacterium]
MPAISCIVPVYNEEKNLEILYAELKEVLKTLTGGHEIIFVNDGSTDTSQEVLKSISAKDRDVKVIRFGRNYGQTAALAAGFSKAEGEVLVTMDGDLQNDPRDIPNLLKKMKEGYDLVSGWRKKRKDPLFTKNIPSHIANGLISFITGVRLHDYGCTLKAYKREAVKNINLYGEMHRFLPALASWNGITIAEIPVNHRARIHGKTKYGLSRTSKVILDLVTVKFLLSFSTKPIQLFGLWGFISLIFSFISGISVIAMKLFKGEDMTGNPFLYLTILLLVVGIQFIMMGLLGEMMSRIYHESRKNPTYIIKEQI